MNICKSGLYRCREPRKYYQDPTDKNHRFLYHCRNWTFTVLEVDEVNGIVTLSDTYFHNKTVRVDVASLETDFELVMDTREFRRVSKDTDLREYSLQDIRIVADDSGGLYNPGKYVRIGAEKDILRQIQVLEERICMERSRLERLESERSALEQKLIR